MMILEGDSQTTVKATNATEYIFTDYRNVIVHTQSMFINTVVHINMQVSSSLIFASVDREIKVMYRFKYSSDLFTHSTSIKLNNYIIWLKFD